MNNETLKRIQQIYNAVLSIVIVITGMCLITACLGIYQSGDQPYSRESVAAAFGSISVPVYLCLGMMVIGFIWEFLSPSVNSKATTPRAYIHIINQLRIKKDLSACEETLCLKLEKEQKNRKLHRTISLVLLVISSCLFLIYALNGTHFHQSEINTSMIQAMYRLIPCVAVSFGYGIFTLYYNKASFEREIELLKQVPSVDAATAADNKHIFEAKLSEHQRTSDGQIKIFRNICLYIGLFFLIYGFITGGTADVLTKAINICTECIGLG